MNKYPSIVKKTSFLREWQVLFLVFFAIILLAGFLAFRAYVVNSVPPYLEEMAVLNPGPEEFDGIPDPLPEKEKAILMDGFGGFPSNPFAEYRKDPEMTEIKYKGKSVKLFGVVTEYESLEGRSYHLCIGADGESFRIVSDDDKGQIRKKMRIIAQGELSEWSRVYKLTVWECRLLELQEPTEKGWKTIWQRK